MAAIDKLKALANSKPLQVPINRHTNQPKTPSAKVRRAIALVASGECTTYVAAATRVGLSHARLSRALREPQVLAYIQGRVRSDLTAATAIAAHRVVELMHSKSDHVSFDASRHVLAVDGVKPPDAASVSVSVNVQPGYVIDLRDPRDLAVQQSIIEHEPEPVHEPAVAPVASDPPRPPGGIGPARYVGKDAFDRECWDARGIRTNNPGER